MDHGRLEGACLEGLAHVPIIRFDHLTKAQKRAYLIADNRIAEQAGWDRDILAIDQLGPRYPAESPRFWNPMVDFATWWSAIPRQENSAEYVSMICAIWSPGSSSASASRPRSGSNSTSRGMLSSIRGSSMNLRHSPNNSASRHWGNGPESPARSRRGRQHDPPSGPAPADQERCRERMAQAGGLSRAAGGRRRACLSTRKT
jgi:hypothetical protein